MVCAASAEGWLVGWVRAGVEGYRPSVLPFAFAGEAAAYVRFINQSLGVDPKAQACMLAGAMVGWEDPRADPRQTEDFETYLPRQHGD
jgi:hypothetical protein